MTKEHHCKTCVILEKFITQGDENAKEMLKEHQARITKKKVLRELNKIYHEVV